jgi:hypothetical protein
MVFLRIHLAVFLAALFWSGCKFNPAVTGLGYQTCDTTADCKSGGLVCLRGLCVPDCNGIYTVARLVPEHEGDAGEYFKKICPGGECAVKKEFLSVELPPGTFLELGSTKNQDDVKGCNRVVIRFSILAPDLHPEPPGRELSVVIRGAEATGVVPEDQDGKILLEKAIEEEDLKKQFRENTYFYVVDTAIFEWPVRLRLVPIAGDKTAFWVRGFELSCCE